MRVDLAGDARWEEVFHFAGGRLHTIHMASLASDQALPGQDGDRDREQTEGVRTDRSGEFTSVEFGRYCADEGAERHLMTPYSPQ